MAKSQSILSQPKEFLSYLATLKGDLSNITTPPFLLSPKSVTEIPATWAERHELFLQPPREQNPARRTLLVLKNYLCSLKRQLYTAAPTSGDSDDGGGGRKPLNAFLGELFLGVAPPARHGVFMYNKKHGISSSGYVTQETSLSPNRGVQVKEIGYSIICGEEDRESHLMALPTMLVKGLLLGDPYQKLELACYICSSSGYLATIEFDGKNSLGVGTKNSMSARITNFKDEGKAAFEISGQRNARLKIPDCRTGGVIEEFDVDDIPLAELNVKALERSPWESRRVWTEVIDGISEGNTQRVSEAKNRIKDAQRGMRDAEKVAGIQWPMVFFQKSEGSQEFELLVKIIPEKSAASLQPERTTRVWKNLGVGLAERLLANGTWSFNSCDKSEQLKVHSPFEYRNLTDNVHIMSQASTFERDLYALFGIERSASVEGIKDAYGGLCWKLHSDRAGNTPENNKRFAVIRGSHAPTSQQNAEGSINGGSRVLGRVGQGRNPAAAESFDVALLELVEARISWFEKDLEYHRRALLIFMADIQYSREPFEDRCVWMPRMKEIDDASTAAKETLDSLSRRLSNIKRGLFSRDDIFHLPEGQTRKELECHLRALDLYRDLDDERPRCVRIYFIRHVSGHKYSANMMIYRRPDAFGIEGVGVAATALTPGNDPREI
ncbi:hypothetical protein DL767_003346 [Monosporascus sp. MG133]|nr:hypothetical protein DL767_003346 [Monosporascus sp. MG133]